jgi:hypothetical protein
MRTLISDSPSLVRDPVAVSIESFLLRETAEGRGRFEVTMDGNEYCVSFGSKKVRAENCDIAFVRLARALLDDKEFSKSLTRALRAPVASANVRAARAVSFCNAV